MEEDIRNIERVIDYIQLESPIVQGLGNATYTDSLKRLIKEYKNLQQIEQEHKKENGALRERIKQVEEELNSVKEIYYTEKDIENLLKRVQELEQDQCTHNIDNECIRKSKVREMIEEYEQVIEITKEKLKHEANVDVRRRYRITIEQAIAGILALQQLLEE